MSSTPSTNLPGIPGAGPAAAAVGAGASSAPRVIESLPWMVAWLVVGLGSVIWAFLVTAGVAASPLPGESPVVVQFGQIGLGMFLVEVGLMPRMLARFRRAVPTTAIVEGSYEEAASESTMLRVRYASPVDGTEQRAEVPAGRTSTEPGTQVAIHVDPLHPSWATTANPATVRGLFLAITGLIFGTTLVGVVVLLVLT